MTLRSRSAQTRSPVITRVASTDRLRSPPSGKETNGAKASDNQDVPTGTSVVLTSAHWPHDKGIGILHRSSPIEAAGETSRVRGLDLGTDIGGSYINDCIH